MNDASEKSMIKYVIGVVVVALISVGLVGFTVSKGMAQRKDKQTESKASELAKELNSYLSTNKKSPESLEELDVDNVPSTISYEKTSSSSYTFCVNYDNASSRYSSIGAESVLFGSGLTADYDSASNYDSYYEGRESSTLYLPYSHKAGESCYKVKARSSLSNRTSYNDYFDNYEDTSNALTNSQATARDTERKSDIIAIQTQLEIYFAQAGSYPEILDLNAASNRAFIFPNLDEDTLRDPSGTSSTLATKPTANQYSYEPKSKTGSSTCSPFENTCQSYVLTAILEDGSSYTKKSLN